MTVEDATNLDRDFDLCETADMIVAVYKMEGTISLCPVRFMKDSGGLPNWIAWEDKWLYHYDLESTWGLPTDRFADKFLLLNGARLLANALKKPVRIDNVGDYETGRYTRMGFWVPVFPKGTSVTQVIKFYA